MRYTLQPYLPAFAGSDFIGALSDFIGVVSDFIGALSDFIGAALVFGLTGAVLD